MTGAAICYGKGYPLLAAESCLPNLGKTIRELQPKLIIPIGELATHSVLTFLWRDGNLDHMYRFFGCQIPAKQWNAWVCPVYDSAYIMSLGYKNKEDKPTGTGVVAYFWLENHVREAIEKLGEPPFSEESPKEPIQLLFDTDTIKETLEQIGNYKKKLRGV
ncbi:MAG: hypothetical protein LBK82_05185 [Planctomycetaceae bacterium]|jgi:hypothetical protein|nr:hypothetical protein [Planctomycetaceae bacterium]